MLKRGRGRPRKIKIENPSLNLSNREIPYSDNLPEFFKIYTPALSSTMMRIPPDFIDKFGGSIPTTCMLKKQHGTSQQVSMSRVNDDWFFQEGWPQFVKENSLNDRDFLTFCYIGESSFLVKIFSPNGCPKVASHVSRVDESSDSVSISDSDSDSDPDPESEEEPEAAEIKRRRQLSHSRWGNPISFKDEKPCFTVKVTKSYLRRGVVRVPLEFWTDYMKKEEENGDSRRATLLVGDEKWSVDLGVYIGRVMFRKGCVQFLKDNSIKIGTKCTFQLIDPNTFSFRVTFK